MFSCVGGNTITITASFKDDANVLHDATEVTAKIYDREFHVIETITNITRVSEGVYRLNYTTLPVSCPTYYYIELSGKVGELTILNRYTLQLKFQ